LSYYDAFILYKVEIVMIAVTILFYILKFKLGFVRHEYKVLLAFCLSMLFGVLLISVDRDNAAVDINLPSKILGTVVLILCLTLLSVFLPNVVLAFLIVGIINEVKA